MIMPAVVVVVAVMVIWIILWSRTASIFRSLINQPRRRRRWPPWQVSPTKFMAVCGIHGSAAAGQPQRAVFIWVCTLQPPEQRPFGNCWLTDAVYRADSASPVQPPKTDVEE